MGGEINNQLFTISHSMANYMSKAFRTQSFGIPPPTLTEANLPDQTGRVHIVTGGYAGVGQELTGITT